MTLSRRITLSLIILTISLIALPARSEGPPPFDMTICQSAQMRLLATSGLPYVRLIVRV